MDAKRYLPSNFILGLRVLESRDFNSSNCIQVIPHHSILVLAFKGFNREEKKLKHDHQVRS